MQRLQNLSQVFGLLAGVLVVSLMNIAPSHAETTTASEDIQNEDMIAESPADSNEEVAAVADEVNFEDTTEAALIIEDDAAVESEINAEVAIVSQEEFVDIAGQDNIEAEVAESVIEAQNTDENEAGKLPDLASDSLAETGDDTFESASAVTEADLDENRATGGSPFSSSYLIGHSSGNIANNTVSGANQVSGNAFAAATGVSTIIQNSGNNVLLQNSTIVNVNILQ